MTYFKKVAITFELPLVWNQLYFHLEEEEVEHISLGAEGSSGTQTRGTGVQKCGRQKNIDRKKLLKKFWGAFWVRFESPRGLNFETFEVGGTNWSFLYVLGGLSTTAMVKIQLSDVNDNQPIFYPVQYNVSLREEGAGSPSFSLPVVQVAANDPDSGKFGLITYRIVGGNDNGLFRIDRSTGEIFVARPNLLSSKNQPYHKLNISATDGGGLRSLTDSEVFISIIDSRQRPPIFEKTRYTFEIKEDSKIGTFIGTVKATTETGKDIFQPPKNPSFVTQNQKFLH